MSTNHLDVIQIYFKARDKILQLSNLAKIKLYSLLGTIFHISTTMSFLFSIFICLGTRTYFNRSHTNDARQK